MPLYPYRCTQCGHQFEKIQHFNSTPLTECPKCKGELVRPLTSPALQFKGTGWYVTDYAGKNAAPAKADAAPSCAGSGPACSSCPAAAGNN